MVCRERLTLIRAAWDWGIADDHLEAGQSNPWVDMVLRVRVEPKQMPKPFTREEMTAIDEGFKKSSY